MIDKLPNLAINKKTYNFCLKAFGTTRKLLKLNIKLHKGDNENLDATKMGDIFLFNHFARFETFIPQNLIHEATGAYCRSVASPEFFEGDARFSQFLYSIGVIPNDLPNLFSFLAKEILHDKKLVIFPEGGMVKDKRVIDKHGQFSIFSRTANERRKHHSGSAVIALALDAFKTALLHEFSVGHYKQVERWAEQLEFDTTEHLMIKALKPTVIVPSHITFYPIRVNDNILHQTVRLFNKGINKRLAEELIIEGNLLFKDTDMDIRFSKPIIVGKYWRWWEKKLLPHAVRRFESLDELFQLKPDKGHWGGRIHSIGLRAKSHAVRDDYMRSMYDAVTINLSHIASYLILKLYEKGIFELHCAQFHKMLYYAIKGLQQTHHSLHRSLLNPAEYGAIVNQGSSRLEHFLNTVKSMGLVHVEQDMYILNKKLINEFGFDEIRTENLISVYANEISPLRSVTSIIDAALNNVKKIDRYQFADFRFDDQLIAIKWDREHFDKEKHQEINTRETATADANWFFLKSPDVSATGVLLIHGFMASPAELRSLGERLNRQGHHVLCVRLKGHGTSPWDLHSRDWQDWMASVIRGFDILKAYCQAIHVVGFSTGGLLAILLAADHPHIKLKSVSCVSAPVDFKNKNMKFVPLLHHANNIVRWVSSEGLVPFRPNDTENPEVNYQHIPIRALYQLQQLIQHLLSHSLKLNCTVVIYQNTLDPVVEPSSADKLYRQIDCENKSIIKVSADRHGIIYSDLANVQDLICTSIMECDQSIRANSDMTPVNPLCREGK